MRQTRLIMAVFAAALLLFTGCGSPTTANTINREDDIVTVTLDFTKQSGYASNQFAVWIEDANGVFIKTLFVTKFTADGGYEKRPDAIPVWVEQSGIDEGTKQDAVSGATPKTGAQRYVWDLTDESGARVPDGTYKFFVEGTLRWKNHVLFSGEIELNGEAASTDATAEYTYVKSDEQPALTDKSPENAMIGLVKAEYIPLKK